MELFFQELRSFLKGVMELEGVKELSHYSVLTFLPRGDYRNMIVKFIV